MDYVFQNDLRIYFFLEYVPGGNIFDHLCFKRRLEEDTVKFIAAQILIGLGYLHANKIVHRDLKPENVLMDMDGYVKLADFGLAKFLQNDNSTKSFCGTAEYLAPEILNMTGHGFAVDWWTFGVLIYEMVTGRPPFMNKNHHKLGILIRQGNIIFPDPERHGIPMSDDIKDIITKLLDKNPITRLGSKGDADEIVNHKWFKGMDWQNLMARKIEAKYKPSPEFG
jgi:serine/threonine protein kinase